MGICGVFLTLGLILARLVVVKYASLSARFGREIVAWAILADHALLFGLPMWTGAFVAALVGHAVFPDERDFRILMALPISQRLIFGAKIAAMALFAGVFIVAIHAALTPIIVAVFVGRPPGVSILRASISFALASSAASLFGFLAVIGVNGLLMLTAKRRRLLAASAAFRSASIVGLIVVFPFVWKLSAIASPISTGAWWLALVPPAWFVGLEQTVAGNGSPLMSRLGLLAAAGFAAVSLVVAATYAVLYRQFDRVMVRPSHGGAADPWHETPRAARWYLPAPRGIAAVQSFTLTTLRRSVLHQGIVVGLGAVGLGLVVNGFLGNASRSAHDALVAMALWAPFVMIFALCSAVRLSLSVPIDERANWIFRMTERESARVQQLRAPVRVMVALGVALPVAVFLPYHWALLGPPSLAAAAVTFLVGLLFVEVLMKQWSRIPFTCSYIPGKGFVPQMLLTAFVVFTLLTTGGSGLVRYTLRGRTGALVVVAVIGGVTIWLQRRRTRRSAETALLFEDQLPTEVNPLRLSD